MGGSAVPIAYRDVEFAVPVRGGGRQNEHGGGGGGVGEAARGAGSAGAPQVAERVAIRIAGRHRQGYGCAEGNPAGRGKDIRHYGPVVERDIDVGLTLAIGVGYVNHDGGGCGGAVIILHLNGKRHVTLGGRRGPGGGGCGGGGEAAAGGVGRPGKGDGVAGLVIMGRDLGGDGFARSDVGR